MLTNPVLWSRLESVAFDELDAAFPFSARLARDNGWTRAFANRVVEEYRRFVYLAFVAGHEVTPSDEVDQAWHLHLTYTRHYWGDFKEALGAPLHHGPTKGGAAENARYADNYEITRAAYEREFGETPPEDIWPSAEVRFGDAPFMQRVNLRNQFLVQRRGVRRAAIGAAFTASAVAMVGAVSAAETGALSLETVREWTKANNTLSVAIIAAVIFALFGLGSMIARAGGGAAKRKSGSGCGAGGAGCGGKADGGDGGSGCGGGGGCGGCGG